MEANGDIYLSKYEGWYSVRDEAYYVEDETVVKDDGIRYSRESDTEVTWTAEESYFFRLSAYQDKLLALYEAQPEFGAPQSRFNEVISFVRRGLEDLSISRTTFDWGVPVPGQRQARHVRVGRRADQLPDRRRLPGRRLGVLQEVLAGRCPRDRQGHLPLPRHLLAGIPHERRTRAAEADHDPRLPAATTASRCPSRWATSWRRRTSSPSTAWTRCATSSCARSPSAPTATTTTRPSWAE